MNGSIITGRFLDRLCVVYRARNLCAILALAAGALILSPLAHAQNARQKLPELTVSQVVEFCEPQLKAHTEYMLAWLLEGLAKQRSAAERGGPASAKWRIVTMSEAEIDDVRNRGYQAARHGSANAELMAWMNDKTTAKDVRESIAGWQVSLNQLDSTTSRASAPSRLCMLGLRLAQIEGKPLATARLGDGATAGRTAMSTQPTVSMSPVKDPFGKVGEGGPNPTPTANPRIVPGNSSPDIGLGVAGAPVGGLSQQRIASCSDEIRRAQLESQSWTGDANAVAARLGQFQKDLFEGRCAGHPEAQAYVAGANKMLGYGGNASGGGGGSLPLLASGGSGESGSGSPDPGRSRKVHNPAADAKSCTQLKNFSTPSSPISNRGDMRFINNCPTAVEFFWCSDAECTRGSGNTWTIGVGGDWPVHGTNVRWGACRGRDSGGFDKDSQGTKYTCPNLKW